MKALLIVSIALCLLSCNKQIQPTLRVYVAASLTDVMQEVGAAFERTHAIQLEYNFAGSGTLAQQIIAAPRADLFLSASEHWMNQVEAADHLLLHARQPLLGNRLAMVTNKQANTVKFSAPEQLPELSFRHLAIGDPDYVPAGQYAKQWLEDHGIWHQLRSRIVPATDVRAALAQAVSRTDLIAIVYRTDYLKHRHQLSLLYELPDQQIHYPCARLSSTPAAKAFYQFLQSDPAQAIYKKHGFIRLSN